LPYFAFAGAATGRWAEDCTALTGPDSKDTADGGADGTAAGDGIEAVALANGGIDGAGCWSCAAAPAGERESETGADIGGRTDAGSSSKSPALARGVDCALTAPCGSDCAAIARSTIPESSFLASLPGRWTLPGTEGAEE
jgi:hypothetical protein